MSEELILKGVQLAYARAIAAIELRFYNGAHPGRRDEDDDMDPAHHTAERIVRQLEIDGDLRGQTYWRQRVPLHDLYSFSEYERALLLDLADAGGVQITRRHDSRFDGLGCGNGGKCAVSESASERWRVVLTERGEALVKSLKEEVGNE